LDSCTTTTTQLFTGFNGSPSIYFVFAVAQDGIAAPADFNASASGYLLNVCKGTVTGATISAPDANNYYTVTLGGSYVPESAVMLTGGVGYTYSLSSAAPLVQVDGPAALFGAGGTFEYNAATKQGGLSIPAPNVWKVATGYTGRRTVVETARCNGCHAQLGVGPTFHAGQRNNAETCSFCHNPAKNSSGWSANISTFIHGLHGAVPRTVPFGWHSGGCPSGTNWDGTYCMDPVTSTSVAVQKPYFPSVEFPGSSCLQCHVPGSFNFENAANQAAVPNLLWTQVNSTGTTASPSISPYVTIGNAATLYGAGFSYNASTRVTTPEDAKNLVTTPIMAACVACHDSADAKTHMAAGGGLFYSPRGASPTLSNPERCLTCHGAGGFVDVAEVHKVWKQP
jgi:OmcA/MtrC family decaheme c-type cytochrome